jgi:hypothetical protein
MTKPISIVFALLLCLTASAQSSLSGLSAVTISLDSSGGSIPGTSPFRHYQVIDARPDTTRIGLHAFIPTLGSQHNRQLVFRQPAAAEIEAFLNARFTHTDAPYTALIVLRNLWLSDANYGREEKLKDPAILHERTHIRLKAEIYAFRDSVFTPILRFDTLQAYKRDNRYTSIVTYYSLWNKDVTAILCDMADSAALLTVTRQGKGRQLHLADILAYNQTRFETPITGNITITPGVYISFEECRNNKPSVQHFEIRMENNYRLLYIGESGSNTYYSHDAWGCSDGKNIYMMHDGVLYPVWKEDRAFYFLAPPTPPALGPDGKPVAPEYFTASSRSETNQRRIYTVDMDTGKTY